MLHLATSYVGQSLTSTSVQEWTWSRKTNFKSQLRQFWCQILCECAHMRTCQHRLLCMLLSAHLHTTVTEGRRTDPLNKMSPPNTTMINHMLQIISTCMSKAKPSPTVWLCAFTLSDSLPTTSTTPRPLLSSLTLGPPHLDQEEIFLKRNNSPQTQKTIWTRYPMQSWRTRKAMYKANMFLYDFILRIIPGKSFELYC